ncbi:hypothetical protein [Acinetobacter phage vB_AbaM_fThrA]|nr:hypothetical protein [Acinetobacter phage vB_AbaM_fThrA]
MKLKCINDDGQKVLKLNRIYNSVKIDGDRVWIEEYKRYSFLLSRFEVI